MSKRKPIDKPYCNGTWTHARMMGFLRSGLRRMSLRWAPKSQCKTDARRPSQSANKRLKWEYQCAQCNEWKAGKDVAVHHVVPCGELRCFDDLPDFVRRLFVESDGFVLLCESCHKEEHNEQR